MKRRESGKPRRLFKKLREEFLGGLAVKDLALSFLWLGLDPLAWELLYAVGVA